MERARGTITVVQESRFLLATDDSRARLMVLAPDANLEPQDLPGLVARGCSVTVDYEPASGVKAATARRLWASQAAGDGRMTRTTR